MEEACEVICARCRQGESCVWHTDSAKTDAGVQQLEARAKAAMQLPKDHRVQFTDLHDSMTSMRFHGKQIPKVAAPSCNLLCILYRRAGIVYGMVEGSTCPAGSVLAAVSRMEMSLQQTCNPWVCCLYIECEAGFRPLILRADCPVGLVF